MRVYHPVFLFIVSLVIEVNTKFYLIETSGKGGPAKNNPNPSSNKGADDYTVDLSYLENRDKNQDTGPAPDADTGPAPDVDTGRTPDVDTSYIESIQGGGGGGGGGDGGADYKILEDITDQIQREMPRRKKKSAG